MPGGGWTEIGAQQEGGWVTHTQRGGSVGHEQEVSILSGWDESPLSLLWERAPDGHCPLGARLVGQRDAAQETKHAVTHGSVTDVQGLLGQTDQIGKPMALPFLRAEEGGQILRADLNEPPADHGQGGRLAMPHR